MKSLLEKTRDINKIIQKAAGHPISFSEMAEKLCENLDSNVYIISKKGKVLGYAFIANFYCPTMDEIVKDSSPMTIIMIYLPLPKLKLTSTEKINAFWALTIVATVLIVILQLCLF